MKKYNNPNTPYVLECLPDWIELYKSGSPCQKIADKYGVSYSCVRKRLAKEGIIRSRSESKLASNNPMWLGDKVGVMALHDWLRRRMPKPAKCSKCTTGKAIDLANISPIYNPDTYNRDFHNWKWLCRKCHMIEDGRINNLSRKGGIIKHISCTIDNCLNKHEAKGFCNKHYKRSKKSSRAMIY